MEIAGAKPGAGGGGMMRGGGEKGTRRIGKGSVSLESGRGNRTSVIKRWAAGDDKRWWERVCGLCGRRCEHRRFGGTGHIR